MVAEAKVLGSPEYKADGTMTFDFFLDTMKIVSKYVLERTKSGLKDFQQNRRAALKEKNDEEY